MALDERRYRRTADAIRCESGCGVEKSWSSGHRPGDCRHWACILSALPCDFGAAIAVVQHRAQRGPSLCSSPRPPLGVDGQGGRTWRAAPPRYRSPCPAREPPACRTRRHPLARPFREGAWSPPVGGEALPVRGGEPPIAGHRRRAHRSGRRRRIGRAGYQADGVTVIAQDEETSEVFGMPRAAIASAAVDYVMPLASIAPALVELAQEPAITGSEGAASPRSVQSGLSALTPGKVLRRSRRSPAPGSGRGL